jgi:hypothetical protein
MHILLVITGMNSMVTRKRGVDMSNEMMSQIVLGVVLAILFFKK